MTGFWKRGKARREGTPAGEIDCAGVMERLYEYIDGELDDGMIERIRRHLEVCKKCYPQYAFEAAFVRFIAEHGRVEVRRELRRKIFRSILEQES